MTTAIAPTPSTPEDIINEASKNINLIRATREMLKLVISSVKVMQAYTDTKIFRKNIDSITIALNGLNAALNSFELLFLKTQKPDAESQALYRRFKDTYLNIALLPYRTPIDDWNALENHINNFYKDSYAVVDDELVDLLKDLPRDYTAGLMELANRYFPEAEAERKKAFAVGAKMLFEVWQNKGILV